LKPEPNSTALTAGTLKRALLRSDSKDPNIGSPSPTGSPVLIHSTIPPCESPSLHDRGHIAIKTVNLFLIADHDFIDEIWIRLAQLPSVKHSLERLEFRLPVSISNRWKMVCNVPIPGITILEYWREQIDLWVTNNSASYKATKSLMPDNFEHFWREVELSYAKARRQKSSESKMSLIC
jgi:hypothetical protein